jgi:hypothetical protein
MTLKAVLCSAMRAYVNDEMVMKMTRREEQYEGEEEELPKEKAPPGKKEKAMPEKMEKIKEGIKSPIQRTRVQKKKIEKG